MNVDRVAVCVALGAALVALSGCGGSQGGASATVTTGPNATVSAALSPTTAVPNGRSIFLTGKDLAGRQITAQRPPMYPSCAACHNTDGSGGKHLPGGAVSADLRYAALVTHQKTPYTLPLLERAISTGVDNEGQPLNPVMPRWRLSPQDVNDVADFVLTQLK